MVHRNRMKSLTESLTTCAKSVNYVSGDSESAALSPCSASSYQQSLTPPIGVNLRITGQGSQGGRKYMEDQLSVAYQQSDSGKTLEYAFVGIYDGHGGTEAAAFAKDHLMMTIVNQRLFWSDSDHDVLQAIREAYIATHYAMWREQDKWPKTANGLPSTAGTTATVAFIRRKKIYIGHVGDSAIVLGYQRPNEDFWRAKQLTVDHKPESTEEKNRIIRSGGKVVIKSGVPRVVWNRPRSANHRGPIRYKTPVDEIPFLAVARSLGDLWSYNSQHNEFVVSPEPDVRVIPINTDTFRCLVFGTDGLWNVITPQEAVDRVREVELVNERIQMQFNGSNSSSDIQWANPSKTLVEQALKTWSARKMRADNTSVVTVILYPPEHSLCDNQDNDVATIISGPLCTNPKSNGVLHCSGIDHLPVLYEFASYKTMAMKYLPPEEYRNFDYYADDSAEDDEYHEWSQDVNQNESDDLATTPLNWLELNEIDGNEQHEFKVVHGEVDLDDEMQTVYFSASACEMDVVDYENYLPQVAAPSDTSDSYSSSFAESYNSLLNCESLEETTECRRKEMTTAWSSSSDSDTTDSNSSYQNITQPDMQEILKEQQLYQEHCMSQAEGYSLTKLETRHEHTIVQINEISLSNCSAGNFDSLIEFTGEALKLDKNEESIKFETVVIRKERSLSPQPPTLTLNTNPIPTNNTAGRRRSMRTRNIPAKGMKAKSVNVTPLNKCPNNVMRKKLMHDFSLRSGNKAVLLNDDCLTQASGRRRSLRNSSTINKRNPSMRKLTTAAKSTFTNVPKPAIKQCNTTTSTCNMRLRSRQNVLPGSFSKSTRSQSSGSNFVVPPPSPKLINAAAAVASATRARSRSRSLLSNKRSTSASANRSQNGVAAVFTKRVSLRRKVSKATANAAISKSSAATLCITPPVLRTRVVRRLKQ